ncbi:hypothetical protein SCHPADRAFT_947374 [Schizopora paradoxa]|uniref:Uncharacterized protein n=1 Tax=Schizopora paradoxa TaxID=27342 RepID=A0A0H2R0S6_9AGAM|nr:hypothetical protein SCHPADRAFT_947374 [Schizopora paradoxa]
MSRSPSPTLCPCPRPRRVPFQGPGLRRLPSLGHPNDRRDPPPGTASTHARLSLDPARPPISCREPHATNRTRPPALPLRAPSNTCIIRQHENSHEDGPSSTHHGRQSLAPHSLGLAETSFPQIASLRGRLYQAPHYLGLAKASLPQHASRRSSRDDAHWSPTLASETCHTRQSVGPPCQHAQTPRYPNPLVNFPFPESRALPRLRSHSIPSRRPYDARSLEFLTQGLLALTILSSKIISFPRFRARLAILDAQNILASPRDRLATHPSSFPDSATLSRDYVLPRFGLGRLGTDCRPSGTPRTRSGDFAKFRVLTSIASKLATLPNQRFLEIEIPDSPRKLFLDIPNGPPRIPCIELYPLTYVPPAPPSTPTRPIAGCESDRHRLPEGYEHLVQRCRYNFFYSPFFHQGSRYQHHSGVRPRLLPRSANNPAPVPLAIEAPPINEVAVPLFDFSRDIFYDDPWRDPDVHFAPLKRTRSESPEPLASSSRRRLD